MESGGDWHGSDDDEMTLSGDGGSGSGLSSTSSVDCGDFGCAPDDRLKTTHDHKSRCVVIISA